MKTFILSALSILFFISTSCIDDPKDCACTLEFRMYLVTIVDSLGNPVDSLQTKVTNSKGKEFIFNDPPPPFMRGAYYVMTDYYIDDFTTRPDRIFFRGTKNQKEINGEFHFNTDDCHCHVHKLAGPDTLVLR